ncbi:hypothetical protein CRM22_002416 [Opisthorchis felineus]|uniref:MICOS complex subunit MIC10 n=1 Tax=Opisthorchis felineus TaxID=147828 RepID=A0A4S2MC44_OPIFE|nr:hypothetical protein CRM22_002416 [Opisthorchis felineus]
MKELVKSEDILGHRWDRCQSDTIIKTASGITIGIIVSVLLAKRRPWPVIFGAGVGIGMGVANCNNDFKQPLPLVSHRIRNINPKASE